MNHDPSEIIGALLEARVAMRQRYEAAVAIRDVQLVAAREQVAALLERLAELTSQVEAIRSAAIERTSPNTPRG